MNLEAVYHRTGDQFCYAADAQALVIGLLTGYDVKRVFLHYGDPFATGILGGNGEWEGSREEIQESRRMKHHLWWEIPVCPAYKRCRYFFELQSESERIYYFEDGFYTEEQLQSTQKELPCFVFPWMNPADINVTPGWVRDTVWYQIFPERFCNGNPENDPENVRPWGYHPVTNREFYGGDLEGVIKKLDYLQQLGITGIYLNPVVTAPSCHKYDTTDYRKIDPCFGDETVMKRLVQEAHKRGIRVMPDGVFNHCGSRFAPWRDVMEKGPESPYFDWFMVNRWPCSDEEGSTKDGRYFSFAFAERMPKLDTNRKAVREYLLEVVREWIEEYDIDGLRLDVANEISHRFCRELRDLAKGLKPDFYILGEIWHDAMRWLEGDEFDAVMNYPFSAAIRDFWEHPEKTKDDFEFAINQNNTRYMHQTEEVLFNLLDSHDTNRLMDQTKDVDVFFQQLAVLFTMPGSPCIFYGTEIAMEGGPDPDCRRCMPWEDIERGVYADIQEQVKQLIALRREYSACKSRRISFEDRTGEPRMVEYVRKAGDGRDVEVLLNCSGKTLPCPAGGRALFARGWREGWLEPKGILIREKFSFLS